MTRKIQQATAVRSRPAPGEVGDQVGRVLDAAAEPHQVGRDRRGRALDRLVGHRLRHLDQRLDAAERLGEREQPRARRRSQPRRGWRKLTIPLKPGQRTSLTPGVARSSSTTAAALRAWASIRRCSVRSPRCTRKQSNGPGNRADRVLDEPQALVPLVGRA